MNSRTGAASTGVGKIAPTYLSAVPVIRIKFRCFRKSCPPSGELELDMREMLFGIIFGRTRPGRTKSSGPLSRREVYCAEHFIRVDSIVTYCTVVESAKVGEYSTVAADL